MREVVSAGETAELFGAAVVDRTERLADEEVRAAVVSLPLFATASGLARERSLF